MEQRAENALKSVFENAFRNRSLASRAQVLERESRMLPREPTSIERNSAVQPEKSSESINSVYLHFFRRAA